MRARLKNNILCAVIGYPIWSHFRIDTWEFWFVGLVAFQLFWFSTLALPVFADRVARKDGR